MFFQGGLMGFLDKLQDEDFQVRFGGASIHGGQWKTFFNNPDLDMKLNNMLDKVQDIIGDAHIGHWVIHDKICGSCKESLPKFRMLKDALSLRLPNYYAEEIELDETKHFNGGTFTGRGLYKKLNDLNQTNGVPTFIQNVKVSNTGQVIPQEEWFVVFVGKLDLFRFLADAFNIENTRLST